MNTTQLAILKGLADKGIVSLADYQAAEKAMLKRERQHTTLNRRAAQRQNDLLLLERRISQKTWLQNNREIEATYAMGK